jgi:hypothetical protein
MLFLSEGNGHFGFRNERDDDATGGDGETDSEDFSNPARHSDKGQSERRHQRNCLLPCGRRAGCGNSNRHGRISTWFARPDERRRRPTRRSSVWKRTTRRDEGFFGNSEAYTLNDKLILWNIGGDDLLVFQRTGTGLSVSAKVLDSNGRIVAQIVDNQFFVNVRDSFRIDASSSHSLLVNDRAGNRVLAVEFLSPRAIKILGTFFGPRGEQISIAEDRQQFGGVTMSGNCFGGVATAIRMD